MSAAFAPDGSRAVTASKDGTLRIWNTAVRYQLQVGEEGRGALWCLSVVVCVVCLCVFVFGCGFEHVLV